MKRLSLFVALLVASVAPAGANVWEQAIRAGTSDPAQDTYDSEMRQGDEHALLANIASARYAEIKNQVTLALASYRAAAAAKPDAAEPYFRIGMLLYSHYGDCDRSNRSLLCPQRTLNRAKLEEIVAAWDAFEERAPLDPRISAVRGSAEILFRRAILNTKLATRQSLEAAARDYEKILTRIDTADGVPEEVVGNLAETYMMLGDLEKSIETYKLALRGAASTSTWYGYAVALDRDEQTEKAFEVIASLGMDQRDLFHIKVRNGDSFFVPEGEKYYYFALADEALGHDEEAIGYWRQFINSGAHPQYQPRARAHLDNLLRKKRVRQPALETPWRGILR